METVEAIRRRGTGSLKWDGLKNVFQEDGLLPMWVADMDFPAPDCVQQALKLAVDGAAFGYGIPVDAYFDGFIGWERERHGYAVKREWLRVSPGVVPAIYRLIQTLTEPEDSVVLLVPVYYPFMNAVRDTGRRLVTSELVNRQGIYTVDYEDFERKITQEQAKLFILSSPHNPVGRVWKREELRRLMDICHRHGVYVLSDEIHHDIIFEGHTHVPTAVTGDFSDRLVTLTSASKTFNLAGMKNSFLILEDPELRSAYDAYVRRTGVTQSSTLDYVAVTAAYAGGAHWLDAVLRVIWENVCLLRQALSPWPDIVISPLEGTYLAWLDLGAVVPAPEIKTFMQRECKIAPDYGSWFYPDRSRPDTHVRLNLATSEENVRYAADRIAAALAERRS